MTKLTLRRLYLFKKKDTCCTARCVAVFGLCDSFSKVKICRSPSSCGCHAIFIVCFSNKQLLAPLNAPRDTTSLLWPRGHTSGSRSPATFSPRFRRSDPHHRGTFSGVSSDFGGLLDDVDDNFEIRIHCFSGKRRIYGQKRVKYTLFWVLFVEFVWRDESGQVTSGDWSDIFNIWKFE